MPRERKAPRDVNGEDLPALDKFLDALPDDGTRDPHIDDDDDDDDDDDGPAHPIDDPGGEPAPLPIAAQVTATSAAPRRTRTSGATVGVSPAPMARGVGARTTRVSPEAQARSPAFQRMREFQESAYQEIDSVLAELNFDQKAYTIRVERTEPQFDENDVKCDGFLAEYKQRVSLADIQRQWGGGTFMIRIHGPHPTTGKHTQIKQERFSIAGAPKPMKGGRGHRDDDEGGRRVNSDVAALVESSERTSQRMFEAFERRQSEESVLEKLLPTLTPMLKDLFSKSGDAQRALLDAQREDRRLEAEARREDQRKADERRKEEDERRRKDEEKAENHRREDRIEERRREDERKLEQAKLEDRRREDERKADDARREAERERRIEERERMREEAAERQRQHERELAAAQDRSRQDAQNQQRQMEMMSASSKQTTEMLMQTMSFQLDSMDKRNNGGGVETLISQMLSLKQLQNTLTGADVEPSGLEKITEGIEKVVTTIAPLASQAWNATRPQKQLQQPQQQQQQGGGKPIVVDLGPVAKAALPAAPIANPGAPGGMGAAVAAGEPPAFDQSTGAPGAPPVDLNEIVNQLVDLPTFPNATDSVMDQVPYLIQSVDLAVQKNWTAEQIVEGILDPFEERCKMLMAMCRGLGPEELKELSASNVPASWAIRSPRGEALAIEAFEMWREDEDDGVEGIS